MSKTETHRVDLTAEILDEEGKAIVDDASEKTVTLKKLLLVVMIRPAKDDDKRSIDEILDDHILREEITNASDTLELDASQAKRIVDRAASVYSQSTLLFGRIVEHVDPSRLAKRRPKRELREVAAD